MGNVSISGTSRVYLRTSFVQYLYLWHVFEVPSNITFAGYVDDNTPYTYSSNMQTMLTNLHEAIEKLFQLFSMNHPIANVDKSHLLTSSKTATDIYHHMPQFRMKRVKLLEMTLEGRLNFDFNIYTLKKKRPVRNVMLWLE